jgi:tRNA A-37 threonylcarbamoyl transferase component Bud32
MATTYSFELKAGPTEAPPPLPSRLQDRYAFRSLLGQGGFGAVYEAWDEVLHRIVAVKVARRDRFDGTTGRQRFLDEARAAAKLKHPDIVAVYDSGTDADGNPFVVFEFISGEALSARLQRGLIPQEAAVSLVIAVAEAIHTAHKAGLIHRDLKPHNILLDAAGHPHVTDFGLAVDERSQREMAGQVAGSPNYMSPEQVRGETQYLDGRTDVWSLGVILYELLLNRKPFTGRNRDELRDEILNREPRPLRALDDAIPPELERICLKCLTKAIGSRYTTAADVAHELRRWQRSQTTAVRRIPVSVQWSAAVLCLMAAGLVVYKLVNPAAQPVTTGTAPVDPGNHAETEPDRTLPVETKATTADPLNWRARLGADPVELFWPAYRGTGVLEFRTQLQAFEINSDAARLVKLGELSEPTAKVAISIRQPLWHGGAGLFFGYREGLYEGHSCARFQLFALVKTFDQNGRHVFRLVRDQVIIYPQTGGLLSEKEWGFHEVTLPAEGQPARLVVEFRDSRVVAAGWQSDEMAELASPVFNDQSQRDDYVGAWGLFHQNGTTWFQHPDLQTPGKPAP